MLIILSLSHSEIKYGRSSTKSYYLASLQICCHTTLRNLNVHLYIFIIQYNPHSLKQWRTPREFGFTPSEVKKTLRTNIVAQYYTKACKHVNEFMSVFLL